MLQMGKNGQTGAGECRLRANPQLMSPMRIVRDVRDLYRSLSEALTVDADAEEEASYELAVSAHRFSRHTKAVVDDKLNFSATLMRAGEVDAANRLLHEFEHDVREEEAALIERVNEVKVAEAIRRGSMTRVRLARVLATAMLGSALLAFSAAGMAVAGLIRERAHQDEQISVAGRDAVLSQRVPAGDSNKKSLHRVRIGDVKLLLTASQLRTIRELTGGTVSESGLEDIIGLLQDRLAAKVQQAIVAASGAVAEVKEAVEDPDLPTLKQRLKKKERQAEKAAREEPEPQPSPEPSDPDNDASEEGAGDDDDDDRRNKDDEEEQLPIKPGDVQPE